MTVDIKFENVDFNNASINSWRGRWDRVFDLALSNNFFGIHPVSVIQKIFDNTST